MNLNQDSIYLQVNHLSSKEEYFPNNVATDFHLKLSKPLNLSGRSWVVGLCEIQFNNILTEEEEDATTSTTYYQIEFSATEGILIDGQPTHTLRTIPYKSTVRKTFSNIFYMPVQTAYIDTCEIRIKVVNSKRIKIKYAEDSVATCTLHFKRLPTSALACY